MDSYDILKAGLLKRFSSFLLDFILLVLLSALFIWMLGVITNYNWYNTRLINAYERYETKHSVSFSITEGEYNSYTDEEKLAYDNAYRDLYGDENAVSDYRRVTVLTFFNTLMGVFLSFLILEFIIPLILKNGITIGKKIFGLKVMRRKGYRINWVTLFIRTFTGKYLIETALPLFLFLLCLFSPSAIIPLIAVAIFISDILLLFCTPLHLALHDLVSSTVVVDSSCRIYEKSEDEESTIKDDER